MKDIISIFFRRKWQFIIFFALMVTIPMSIVYVVPKKYKAQASLLLTPGRYKKPFIPGQKDSPMSFVQVTAEDVASEVEIILSNPIVSRVVDEFKLYEDNPPTTENLMKFLGYYTLKGLNVSLAAIGLKPEMDPRDVAIIKLQSKIDVDFVKRTNIITLEYSHSNPEMAANIINSVVENYIRHHISIHGNLTALSTIKKLRDESLSQLNSLEDSLRAYSNVHKIYEIEYLKKELTSKLSEAQNKFQILNKLSPKKITPHILGDLIQDKGMINLAERLQNLKLDRIEYASKYGPNERKIISFDKEIAEIERQLVLRHQQNIQTWQRLITTYQGELDHLYQSKSFIENFEREIMAVKEVYQLNEDKYHQIMVSKKLDNAAVSAIKIVESATVPSGYAFPNRMIMLIVTTFFGVVFGIAYAFAYDKLRGKFYSASELEHETGLPVISVIPEMMDETMTAEKQEFYLSRNFAQLKNKIFEEIKEKESYSFMITSPSKDSGTSFNSQHFSSILSKETGDFKILLINIDFNFNKATPSIMAQEIIDADALGTQHMIKKSDSLYHLNIQIPFESVVAYHNIASKVIAFVKDAGFKLSLYNIPSDSGDLLYLKFIPYVDSLVINVAYDITSNKALERMLDLAKQNQAEIIGTTFSRQKRVIPPAIFKLIG